MKCHDCECVPSNNDELYYEIRTTTSGKDLTNGLDDQKLCQDCLGKWIGINGFSQVVSITRIENPIATTGDE